MKPLLSVLVATVPNRLPEPAVSLYKKLCAQADNQPVEVILLGDNRRRTLGQKMNDLLRMAQGLYLTFADDDDDVADNYTGEIMKAIVTHPTDVVCFDVRCTLTSKNGRVQESLVKPSLFHDNQEFQDGGVTLRKPMQIAVWKSDLARRSRWPQGYYEVDVAWAKPLWEWAKSEYRIPQILYHYKWSEATTEAK